MKKSHEPTIIANTVEVILTDSSTYVKRTALLTAAFTKPRFSQLAYILSGETLIFTFP